MEPAAASEGSAGDKEVAGGCGGRDKAAAALGDAAVPVGLNAAATELPKVGDLSSEDAIVDEVPCAAVDSVMDDSKSDVEEEDADAEEEDADAEPAVMVVEHPQQEVAAVPAVEPEEDAEQIDEPYFSDREGKRRRFSEFEDPYENTHSDEDESFNPKSSGEEVHRRNIKKFTLNEIAKLTVKGRGYYKKASGFKCPWHPTKPKGGKLYDLMQHVKQLAASGTNDVTKGRHLALLEVLTANEHV